ncbi:signal peptidase I [Listeria grandensis]|uniref:Signal peptidase I n=1 Tax=Listeria grandensis TaxID=1494963 RepID=A0A7X0Y5K6_9LIST|nr:signal peptidase I [Listeria grandensis]MBC1937452.1 signal peptidase I [Listeria grandensis]
MKIIISSALSIILLAFIVHQYLASFILIDGESMSPSLKNGEVKVLYKMNIDNIERFDVIVFKSSDSPDLIVKRVVGLPGDFVDYRNNSLFINNTLVEEPFLSNLADSDPNYLTQDFKTNKISENHYFVLGDNRQISDDSRVFGEIDKSSIIGILK